MDALWPSQSSSGKKVLPERPLDDFYVLDFETKQWTRLPSGGPSRPAPRMATKLAHDRASNSLYLTGGREGYMQASKRLDDMWRYDISREEWSRIPGRFTMPLAGPCAIHNGAIWSAKGEMDGNSQVAITRYDLRKGKGSVSACSTTDAPYLLWPACGWEQDGRLYIWSYVGNEGGVRHDGHCKAEDVAVWSVELREGGKWTCHPFGLSTQGMPLTKGKRFKTKPMNGPVCSL